MLLPESRRRANSAFLSLAKWRVCVFQENDACRRSTLSVDTRETLTPCLKRHHVEAQGLLYHLHEDVVFYLGVHLHEAYQAEYRDAEKRLVAQKVDEPHMNDAVPAYGNRVRRDHVFGVVVVNGLQRAELAIDRRLTGYRYPQLAK